MRIWPFQSLRKDKLHHPATVSNLASLVILLLVVVLAIYYAPELEKEQGRDLAVDIGTLITPGRKAKSVPESPGKTELPAPSSQKSSP